MATEPTATPLANIERDITWIRGHILASILAIALIAGSIIGGISLFESQIEKHDARVAAAQLQKEGVDTAAQAALLAQLAQDRAANTARDAQQTALIQTLVQQMSQQRAQTAQQIKTDATLDIKQAAQRLAAQMKAEDGSVGIQNDLVTMTLPLTRNVVAALDLLPQAESDVKNFQAQLDAQIILTSDAKVEASDAKNVIAADKIELIDTIKSDNAACKVELDMQAKKHLKRGFWATIGGILGGIAIRSVL